MTIEPGDLDSASIEFGPIEPPDGTARAAALAAIGALRLGKLDRLGGWVAGCQGHCPPRPFTRPRVVVFAADHGIAAREVSVHPAGSTASLLDELAGGGTAAGVFADVAGAGVRVVDVAVDADGTGAAPFKVRRSSGAIDVEDALTDEEVRAAVRAGIAVADAEVDAGADLLIAANIGVGSSTPAATLVAALTGTEPVAVTGRGSGIDDNAWMRKAAAVRDALRRGRPFLADPLALIRTVGGADLAALAGFLAQATVRRTPVLLDGLVVAAAALVAEELAPGALEWWLAAQSTPEPAHSVALDQLGLEPLLDLGITAEAGTGALAALPLVIMVARVLAGS
ncbi:MAG: nicotinate-nucleotide--dimethylbenzimidazole phosphoribosyltransferase [Haloechinothrix sp.]